MRSSFHAPFEVLLVEDSPTDRLLTTAALQDSTIVNNLHTVENGVDAMSFLRQEGKYFDAPRPDLVLLDLNLPRMDGREVLARAKSDPRLRTIPIIVLTTSQSSEDIIRAYTEYANSYIAKPVDMAKFTSALETLGNYWFDVVSLPDAESTPLASKEIPSRSTERALKILLVEDNDSDALLLRHAMAGALSSGSKLRREVRLADVRKAFEAGETFDVIVSDLGLPDSQGLETLRELKKMGRGAPLVALTGTDDEALGRQAMKFGAQDYLVKGELTEAALSRSIRYAVERHTLQAELLSAQRAQLVAQLSSYLAQDFNNLFTVLSGNFSLMSEVEPNETPQLLAEMDVAIRRGAMLTRRLLSLGKGKHMGRRLVQVERFLRDAARLLGELLVNARVMLQLDSDLPDVECSPVLLEEIMLHSSLSMLEASQVRGELVVSARLTSESEVVGDLGASAAGRFVCLGITFRPDAGSINAEGRTTSGTAPLTRGAPLPSLSETIVQQGGWLQAKKSEQGFSTVEVFLPPVTPEQPAASLTPARRELRILVVDDEVAIQRTAGRALESKGHEVFVASSVSSALVRWDEEGPFDVVLTDVTLDGQSSGFDLARSLRQRGSEVPVIFSSGYLRADSAVESGIEGHPYLEKPYTPAELRAMVERVAAPPSPAGAS